MPPKPKDVVILDDLGQGRGQSVPLARQHLEDVGLDPDARLCAARFAHSSDPGSIYLRIHEEGAIDNFNDISEPHPVDAAGGDNRE